MRKITEQAAFAFDCRRKFSQSNTLVQVRDDGTVTLLLHGNAIARREEGKLSISLAGWDTLTTRERLNGLLYVLGLDTWLKRDKGVTFLVTGSETAEMPLNEWVTV